MMINNKVVIAALSFVTFGFGTTVAQSLEDAKKAVISEQYQKAKGMFANLITTQPTVGANYFYFGDLYLRTNNVDSAKIIFQKGIAADSEYRSNYIGLGTIDLFAKNEAAAQVNFDKATAGMKRKDYQEFIQIGNAYTYDETLNIDKALQWLERAKENGAKDPELYISLGNAYKLQKKNSEAIAEYQRAGNLQSNNSAVEVNVAEIWTAAYNFDLAESTLNAVIAKDPNFGPAYRALAENSYRWGSQVLNRRAELLNKAKEQYSKFLDLTDRSVESQYRYLIFLLNAGDYATLETEAQKFVTTNGNNPKFKLAERFLGYAAAENGNTELAVNTLNNFINSYKEGNVIARDYSNLAKVYLANKQADLALENYEKAYALDTTNAELVATIAKAYFSNKKYGKAGDFYKKLSLLPKATFTDIFYVGYSYYFYYAIELVNQEPKNEELIKRVLLDADSAFTQVAVKAKNADAYLYLARVEYYLDVTDKDLKAVAAYDKYIELTLVKANQTATDKKNLVEAYSYIGAYYITRDKVKAKDYFTKALAIDPENAQVKDALRAIAADK